MHLVFTLFLEVRWRTPNRWVMTDFFFIFALLWLQWMRDILPTFASSFVCSHTSLALLSKGRLLLCGEVPRMVVGDADAKRTLARFAKGTVGITPTKGKPRRRSRTRSLSRQRVWPRRCLRSARWQPPVPVAWRTLRMSGCAFFSILSVAGLSFLARARMWLNEWERHAPRRVGPMLKDLLVHLLTQGSGPCFIFVDATFSFRTEAL